MIDPGKKFPDGIDHAGILETSLMLTIRPDLVNLKKLKKPYGVIDGDDPLLSNREKGQAYFKEIVEYIANQVLN